MEPSHFTRYKKAVKKLFAFMQETLPQVCSQTPTPHYLQVQSPANDAGADAKAAGKWCKMKFDDSTEHFEQISGFDTIQQSFSNAGYLLWQRKDFQKKDNAITAKFNSAQLEPVLNAPLRPAAGVEVKTKFEKDIYPCRRKYARSDKFPGALQWQSELVRIEQLVPLFDNLHRVITPPSPSNTSLIRLLTFARRILEVETKIELKSTGEKIETKFVAFAQYDTVSDAEDGRVVPQKVELSFRVTNPITPDSQLHKLVDSIYAQIGRYESVINNKC